MNEAASAVSLRCGLGWHAPDPVARWNDGYYFTRCRRCGGDLVRTAYGRWRTPRGCRVVWRSSRPEGTSTAELVRSPPPAPRAGDRASAELPIQAVLRHLQAGEGDVTQGAQAARTRPPSYVPDFMEDAATDTSWRTNRPPSWPPAAPEGRPARAPDAQAAAPRRPLLPDMRAALARMFESDRSEWFARLYIGLLAALVLLLFWVVLVQDRRAMPSGSEIGTNTPAEVLPAGQPAFVTASVLNCRSAPAAESPQLERLVRGDRVDMLARDGEWASVSHEGRQCWTLIRYLAFDQPI